MKRRWLTCLIALALATAGAIVPARDRPRAFGDLWLATQRLFGSFEASAETRRLLAQVVRDLRRLDLRSLYEALPDSGRPDGARLVVFAARSAGPLRRLEHAAFRSPLSSAELFEPAAGAEPLVPIGPAVGDGWLIGGALPLDRERFRVRVATALRIGEADLTTAGAVAADFLRRVEQRVRRGEGDALSATLADDLPATAKFLGHYFELGGEAAWSEDRRRLRLAPLVRSRRDALARDYPLFVRFLARLTDVLRASGSVTDDSRALVATWASGGPEGTKAEAAFRDGRLLPLRADGAGHDLERPLRFRFTTDAAIEAVGLRTSITGLHGRIELDPPAGRWATSATGMPYDTRIEGALFGLLDPGSIDLLIPGTLESILQDLLRSMFEGREKRGVDLAVRAVRQDGTENVLSSDLALDVSSARLVRVALTIGARWLYPDDAEAAEARRFASEVAAKLREDSSSKKRSTTGAISRAWVTTKR